MYILNLFNYIFFLSNMFDKRVVCINSSKVRITKQVKINDSKGFKLYETLKTYMSLDNDTINFNSNDGRVNTNLTISNVINTHKKNLLEKTIEYLCRWVLFIITNMYETMIHIIPGLKSKDTVKVIEVYLDTQKIIQLMNIALGSIKNGDLLILTREEDTFDFTSPFLQNDTEIPCIYEYLDSNFIIYKHQPGYETQLADDYIEHLKDNYPLLTQNDEVMPNMITKEEENHLLSLIGDIYIISLEIDKHSINHDILDFSKNQIDYFLKNYRYLEKYPHSKNTQKMIDNLISDRKRLKNNYVNTLAKYFYLRCKRFFDKKIDLKQALIKGLTEEEFNSLDINNEGYITVSKFNTKKTYI